MLSSLVNLNEATRRAYDQLADRLIVIAQRTPYSNLPGYQNRWWLVQPINRLGYHFSARIHQILRSDLDRHHHDHPYNSMSLILKSSYLEKMPRRQHQPPFLDNQGHTSSKLRRPGDIVFRSATNRHSLEMVDGHCWTLFIFFGRKNKPWGFHTHSGWVWWRIYLKDWDGITHEEITRAESRDPLVRFSIPAQVLALLP